MLLLDTNVLSEFRKINVGKGDSRVKAWAQSVDAATLFLSVISIFELQYGTELVERRDKIQGAILRSSLEQQVLPGFEGRILLSISLSPDIVPRCTSRTLAHIEIRSSPPRP